MIDRTQEHIMQSWNDSDPCKVSIICSTYNHEKFISEAVDSFLMQETDFPFEIIIHDDASDDDTRKIISDYVHKYPRLINAIYQDKNTYSKGASPIIRSLLDACGEYVAICEGDDYWLDPDKLVKQITVINDNPGCTIVSHRVCIKNSTIDAKPYAPYIEYNHRTYKFEDVLNNHFIPTLSIFFKKSTFPVDDSFYLKNIVSRDIAIELILLRSESGFGVHLKEEMGMYRHHDAGITKKVRNCSETLNQYLRMLDVVGLWVGVERRHKLRGKKITCSLEKEICLIKQGNMFSSIKFIYLCMLSPVISVKFIINVIRYRIL